MYPFNGLSIIQYLKYTLDFLTIFTIYIHDLIWSPLITYKAKGRIQKFWILCFKKRKQVTATELLV